ncbi:MAG TPA: methyltransferase domain-containing protein [Vicinamibacteria bacterium]|nr:methyltransferase domain-containing protein [Vicinamibacteria bacterium]
MAGRLDSEPGGLRCPRCRRLFPALADEGYLDLRPPADMFSEITEYAEEEFHYRLGRLRRPFLSARVKLDMMSNMLKPTPGERVLDIGCGNGRFVFFERKSCGELVGIDAGAHFAAEPLASVDLARGDIRLLPFADATFDKAYSLDVLEHLTEDGVVRMFSEARRVLRPGGRLFVYSHVMMSSKLAAFQRGVNRLVQWLDSINLVDNAPERERKSDHRNALRSYEQLDAILARTGFAVDTIRYYNVFFKAIIEDLMLPLVEHNLYRRRAKAQPVRDAETLAARPDVGRFWHAPLTLASFLMKLDVLLFGRVRTGPFFVLLRAV